MKGITSIGTVQAATYARCLDVDFGDILERRSKPRDGQEEHVTFIKDRARSNQCAEQIEQCTKDAGIEDINREYYMFLNLYERRLRATGRTLEQDTHAVLAAS